MVAETILRLKCQECDREFLINEVDVDQQTLSCPFCGSDVDLDEEEEEEADEEDEDLAV